MRLSLFYGTCLLILMVVAALNVFFEYHDPSAQTIVERAAAFAVATRGVTSIPEELVPTYKLALLDKEKASIDGIMLGSSALLGLRPPSIFGSGHWLNQALDANFLFASIAEAEESLKISQRLRFIAISLDWELTMPFSIGAYNPVLPRSHPPLLTLLRDILSTSRSARTIAIVALQLPESLGALFGIGTVDRCRSGELTISFTGSGSCSGTRYDGSSAFFDVLTYEGHLDAPPTLRAMLDRAKISQSIYYRNLMARGAVVPPENYQGLGRIASALVKRGGKLTLVFPPMLPGLAKVIDDDATSGPVLRRFKAEVMRWSKEHDVGVIDLNESENFGCSLNDFADGHHGLSTCWDKIAARYDSKRGRSSAPSSR